MMAINMATWDAALRRSGDRCECIREDCGHGDHGLAPAQRCPRTGDGYGLLVAPSGVAALRVPLWGPSAQLAVWCVYCLAAARREAEVEEVAA